MSPSSLLRALCAALLRSWFRAITCFHIIDCKQCPEFTLEVFFFNLTAPTNWSTGRSNSLKNTGRKISRVLRCTAITIVLSWTFKFPIKYLHVQTYCWSGTRGGHQSSSTMVEKSEDFSLKIGCQSFKLIVKSNFLRSYCGKLKNVLCL